MTFDPETWATPQSLFDSLNAEFDFVLDAAANDANHKCDIYFTKEDDGLAQDWYPHKRIWLNPPYDSRAVRGNLMKWVGKAHSEAKKHCLVACLLPASTDTKWWHQYCVDGEQRFIKGRLKFNDGQGRAPFGSVIVIFSTWRMLVKRFIAYLGGKATLSALYDMASNMVHINKHVNEKIRQTLQRYPEFSRLDRGLWAI
jgi:phage N-6-adenine-methyltransferase